MKTIFRLLIIAGLVSFARGPLQTVRTEHPVAWREAMTTLKSIPQTVGQLLAHEAALLPSTPPSSSNQNTTTSDSKMGHTFGGTPSSNVANGSAQNSGANPLNYASGASTPGASSSHVDSSQTAQGGSSTRPPSVSEASHWILSAFKALVTSNANSQSSSSNAVHSTASSDTTAALARIVSGSSLGQGALKNVQIDGFTHSDVTRVMTHVMGLDLMSVLPKLHTLSNQLSNLSVLNQPLSAHDQQEIMQDYSEAMSLLSMNSTFYLQKGADAGRQNVSLSTLLNEPDLSKDQVTVRLKDAKTQTILAQFTIKAKPTSSVEASSSNNGRSI